MVPISIDTSYLACGPFCHILNKIFLFRAKVHYKSQLVELLLFDANCHKQSLTVSHYFTSVIVQYFEFYFLQRSMH